MIESAITALGIDGLAVRPLRDENDYTGMAAVRAGSVEWDRIDPRSAREAIPCADDLARTFPLALLRGHPDLRIATVDGQIVGYSHVCWRWTEVTGERVYLHLGYLLPGWRNRGIGSALLAWSQGRIRELLAADQQTEQFGVATFATNASSTEREANALVQEAGYTVVRRLSDMALTSSELDSPGDLPPGVELRPLAPDHHRALYAAWKDAYASVWTSTPPSEEDFREFADDLFGGTSFDPALCAVAWAGEEVAGFVVGQIAHAGADGSATGVIAEVAVRSGWRRRGIARALLTAVLAAMAGRGVTHVRLYTDAENGQGARSLYEDLGFREVKQHLLYRKPIDR